MVRPLTNEAYKTIQIAICIFLVVATFAVYWQVLDHEFLNYDDKEYVINNWNVKAGLTPESIKWAFTTGHFANWHPMTWLSHMLDFQLYGSHPKGHLLINLLIHIANALLLFLVLDDRGVTVARMTRGSLAIIRILLSLLLKMWGNCVNYPRFA